MTLVRTVTHSKCSGRLAVTLARYLHCMCGNGLRFSSHEATMAENVRCIPY